MQRSAPWLARQSLQHWVAVVHGAPSGFFALQVPSGEPSPDASQKKSVSQGGLLRSPQVAPAWPLGAHLLATQASDLHCWALVQSAPLSKGAFLHLASTQKSLSCGLHCWSFAHVSSTAGP